MLLLVESLFLFNPLEAIRSSLKPNLRLRFIQRLKSSLDQVLLFKSRLWNLIFKSCLTLLDADAVLFFVRAHCLNALNLKYANLRFTSNVYVCWTGNFQS